LESFSAFSKKKKYDAYVPRVESFLKRYPQHGLASQALMQLGDYYQQERMREKAVRTYRELVSLYPQSEWAEEAQFRVALLLKQERRWAEAIEEMEKVIRLYPQHLN
jgi:outer membrane protein assembly factor BamD (BamD/ComL family)